MVFPSILHDAGLQALEEALENRNHKQISTDKLVKMDQFVLKNNFFEFNNDVFQQISGTAIGTKSAPPYACIFMDQIEIKFLRTQSHEAMVWFRYIDNIFFIWTHEEEKLEEFIADFNAFNSNIQFTYEPSEKSTAFLDLDVALYNGRLEALYTLNPLIEINICTIHPHFQSIQKDLLYLVKLYVLVEFVLVKRIFEIIASK